MQRQRDVRLPGGRQRPNIALAGSDRPGHCVRVPCASLLRDSLVNYDWQTTFGYLQDSYTKKRLTINGGLRYDYQWSKFLGGCLRPNPVAPDVLLGQCQDAADPKQPFHNVSPRVSATYDLSGKGTTAIHSSYSYYYESKRVLANNISNLGERRGR